MSAVKLFILFFSSVALGYQPTFEISNFPATQVVSGTVSVLNFPATQAVTGTFYQATQPISAASLPLPTGASTAANQTTAIGHLANISSQTADVSGAIVADGDPANGNFVQIAGVDGSGNAQALKTTTGGLLEINVLSAPTTAVTGTFWQATQPVSLASVPLATNAATAAYQASIDATLTSLNGKVTAVNTGAVVVSSSALPSGAATSAKQDTGNTSVASIDTKTPSLGQATMANSSPVVIASNQSAIPISTDATTLAIKTAVETIDNAIAGNEMQVDVLTMPTVTVNSHAVTNAGTFAVQATQAGSWTVTSSNASVSQTGVAIPTSATLIGGSDGANMRALRTNAAGVLSSDVTGSVITAKLQDSTGTNWSMGQKSMSSSMPVTIADNQTSLKVSSDFTILQGSTTSGQKGELGFGAVTTSAPSYTTAQSQPLSIDTAGNLRVREQSRSSAVLVNVADQATSINIVSSDATRANLTIVNDSTAILYIKFGATASTTSFSYKIGPDGTFEMPTPIYTGAIDGIWSADASGSARSTSW
jgi:hypothetical protein